jgi:predicted nucleic acid-binding protein
VARTRHTPTLRPPPNPATGETLARVAEGDAEDINRAVTADAGALIVSPFVLAEVDYMIMTRSGPAAELILLNDLADGVYQVAEFTPVDAARIARLAGRYADLKLGITDAHTMTLTEPDRYDTKRLLTLDHRHFRAVKPPGGGVFTILPADLS